MNNPSVSIIIPVFNGRKTLENCLRSIREQTLPVHEILVIDGGSTDGTQAILQSNENRIHFWSSEPDNGVYDAINKGIHKATGDWIYILGSDDAFASNDVIETISNQLTDSIDLVFGSIRNLHVKHALVPEVHISSLTSTIYFRNTLHQQSAFYRRKLFDNECFDASMRVLADYDFHMLLYKQNVRSKRVDLIVAHCEAAGLSKRFNSALYREEFRLKKKRLGLLCALLLSPFIAGKFVIKNLR